MINKLDWKDPSLGLVWTEFDQSFLKIPQELNGYLTIFYFECEWIEKNPDIRNSIDVTSCYVEENVYSMSVVLI
jgi:hypothetical protein